MNYSQVNDIILLRALHSFLTTSFGGSSFGGLEMDDCVAALGRVIADVEQQHAIGSGYTEGDSI